MQENKAELKALIEKAILGDKKSLEILLTEVQNTELLGGNNERCNSIVFNGFREKQQS